MEPADMADVLSAAAVYDGRTIGRTDVIGWHAAAGHLDRADSLAAVVKHYSAHTDRLMPAHLIQGVQAIRNERAAKQHHEILALPSRFELDDARDARIKRHLPELMAKWSMTPNDPGDPHAAAVTRAKADRRADAVARRKRGEPPRPAQVPRPRREPGKPVDLDKVTTGPDWANAENREREAVLALHRAGHPCGKRACARETCRPATVDAP